ncbi:MAG: hypothetical protein KF708_12590 [Pirellulales bacterium]|nr:hypothetical protein [Pirellulales bacterium]
MNRPACFDRALLAVVAVLLSLPLLLGNGRAVACPFCSAVSLTLTEEINTADLAVIAKIAPGQTLPSTSATEAPAQATKTKFEIVEVLKGQEHVKPGDMIDVFYFGQDAQQPEFMITAIDPKMPSWGTPIGLSERAGAYVRKLLSLPPKGADRLAFFQDYFEDTDPILAADAYDEFARAPYAEVQELKERMPHAKLLEWIQNPEVTASRKRLYLTMLGVCGTRDDVPVLKSMIESDDRQAKTALDAVVACYLLLEGPDGLPLVEDRFLKNKEAEYTDTYAVIMALRFHGQEVTVIPKERLVEAMRHMLGRPQLADLVIADLARWEDWQSMPRLVELFKGADEESGWVRVPVVNFLRACPLPEAQTYLAELAEIDPDAVKRANSFLPLPVDSQPALVPAASADDATPATPTSDASAPASDTTASADVTSPADVPAATTEVASPMTDTDGDATTVSTTTAPAASGDTPGGSDEGDNLASATPVPASPVKPLATPNGDKWSWAVFATPIVAAAVLVILLMLIFRGQRGSTAI